jgi:class 3 adenylate cyclase
MLLQNNHKTVPSVILLIEDNRYTQRMLTKQLKFHGFDVICKDDGRSGMEWLSANRADIIVLDVMLPDADGIEICSQIRKQYPQNVLPIMMLSALGHDATDRARGIKAGANDFMAKPYHIEELLTRLRALLQAKTQSLHAEELLSRYITPTLRKESALNPEMLNRNEQGHAVVMFADLRGFTRLTASTPVVFMFDLLNEFFESMMPIIEEHGGVILDVLGDQLMAVFNVPNPVPVPAHLSVQAALKMQRIFRVLKSKWAEAGMEIGLGIGVHQGEVMVGNLGGGALKRYTAIGTPVNIASRLLSLAKDGQIVVSDSIFNDVRMSPDIQVTTTDDVILKGIDTPQTVYHLQML